MRKEIEALHAANNDLVLEVNGIIPNRLIIEKDKYIMALRAKLAEITTSSDIEILDTPPETQQSQGWMLGRTIRAMVKSRTTVDPEPDWAEIGQAILELAYFVDLRAENTRLSQRQIPRLVTADLPEPGYGSVVLDKEDQAWQRFDSDWTCNGGHSWSTWEDLNTNWEPLTLIHENIEK